MRTVDLDEAQRNLADLLQQVQRGREIIITDRRRPVARLAPIEHRLPFADLADVRRAFRGCNPSLSDAVLEERDL